jgi:hypothetical protein
MHTVGARRLQGQNGGADVASELHIVARLAQHMGDERRGGRLAVSAGDRHEGRVRCNGSPLAAEELHIADHLDAGRLRELRGPVGLRVRERHARREQERIDPRPVQLAQIAGADPLGPGLVHLGGIVVARRDAGAPLLQRERRRKARAAEPEQRNMLAAKGGDGRHRATAA